MKGAKTIVQKELTRVFKDKKLIFSLFILPALLIVGLYSLMGQMINNMIDDVEQHKSIVYIQYAPEGLEDMIKSVGYTDNADITYITGDAEIEDIQGRILSEEVDLLVSFPETFLQDVNNYTAEGDVIPEITISYNTAADYSTAAYNSFQSTVLDQLKTTLLTERLGNLEQLTIFHTTDKIIVNEDKENGKVLAMILPYLITFMLFVGAMSLGVDAITGEKERGTMAKLLLTPIKRSEIVFGKLISLAILSSISAIIYAVAMIVAMPMMASSFGAEAGELGVKFSALQIVQLLVIMLLMVYLYVGLVSLVAVVAKTAKEANTYVTPIYIVVIVAGLLTMYQGGFQKPLYTYAIPVYGNSLAIQNIMTNELTWSQFGCSISGTLILALIITGLLTKAFNNEKVMFNA